MRKIIVSVKSFFVKITNYASYYFRHVIEIIKYGKVQPFDKRDEQLLIVGNGPSAGKLDYNYYINNCYYLMCVNDFALHFDLLLKYKPKYYCIIDDLMYDPNQLKNNDNVIGVFDNLNKVDWEMIFLCRHCQTPNINNPHIKVVRISDSVLTDSFSKPTLKRYRKNKATPGYQNVICCCAYFAITSLFKKVLITGVEFDMHKELIVDINNDVFREYRHFYGVKKVNITAEGQIGKGEIYKYFYYSYLTLYQFKLLSEYAKHNGVNIKLLTTNSTIDSFEKIEPKEQ